MFGKDSEQDRIAKLARIDRFKNLSDDEIKLVVKKARHFNVPEHWALMSEHTPGDKAYLILEGEVSIRQHGEEIARVGAGDVVGEMALVDQRLRSATVVAMTPLDVLHFTDELVTELSAEIPGFREALVGASQERHGG